jgi:hypothetical protein
MRSADVTDLAAPGWRETRFIELRTALAAEVLTARGQDPANPAALAESDRARLTSLTALIIASELASAGLDTSEIIRTADGIRRLWDDLGVAPRSAAPTRSGVRIVLSDVDAAIAFGPLPLSRDDSGVATGPMTLALTREDPAGLTGQLPDDQEPTS